MSKKELEALVNGLIAMCQREDLLPTEINALCDELQSISSEMYIPKSELVYFFE